jgi:hypothetical protein
MTDHLKANQAMIDALSSFCPVEMMGKYDGPPKRELNQDTLNILNSKGREYRSGKKFFSLRELKNNFIDKTKKYLGEEYDQGLEILINTAITDDTYRTLAAKKYIANLVFKVVNGNIVVSVEDVEVTSEQSKENKQIIKKLFDSLKNDDIKTVTNLFEKAPHNKKGDGNRTISNLDEMTTYIWNNSNGLRVDLKEKVQKLVNDMRAVVNLPKLFYSTTKSTFGSMSHFGSGSGLFLLFLIIVVGVLYYLHSKGKLKFPTMGQRIAQFGRDMKSIRGIRARR